LSTKNLLSTTSAAFSEVRAWKILALILFILCAYLTQALLSARSSSKVIVMPYAFATANPEKMDFSLSSNLASIPKNYLAALALSDLSLILNVTPENAQTQTRRFLNRLHTATFGKQKSELLTKADEYKTNAYSQFFSPAPDTPDNPAIKITTSKDTISVTVRGELVRSQSAREVSRISTAYTVVYTPQADGALMVDAIAIAQP